MVTTLPEVVSGKRYKNVGDLKNTAETSVILNFKRTRTEHQTPKIIAQCLKLLLLCMALKAQ